MKAIVCGGRDLTDGPFVFRELDRIDAEQRIDLVIEGGQRTRRRGEGTVGGADYHANRWAVSRGRLVMRFDAAWHEHGRSAGPMRNARMLQEQPDVVIALPGGSGTRDMIRQAGQAGVPVVLVCARVPA